MHISPERGATIGNALRIVGSRQLGNKPPWISCTVMTVRAVALRCGTSLATFAQERERSGYMCIKICAAEGYRSEDVFGNESQVAVGHIAVATVSPDVKVGWV